VAAPRPAARPTLALLQLLLGSTDAAFSSHLLLCILDPADELIASQRSDVHPGIQRPRVGDQRVAQVCREFVDDPTRDSLAGHWMKLSGIVATDERHQYTAFTIAFAQALR
jgi:hypothetical protein